MGDLIALRWPLYHNAGILHSTSGPYVSGLVFGEFWESGLTGLTRHMSVKGWGGGKKPWK